MTMLEIFEVKESYKLPDAIMDKLLSEDAEKYVRKVKEAGLDIRDTFQEEQGDRKTLKQDFTPDCICRIVALLTKTGDALDMCSGTGSLGKEAAMQNKTRINEQEYSERTIPFAILDACINGLEGRISRKDCLRDIVYESYELQRAEDISIVRRCTVEDTGRYENVIMNPPYSMKFPDAEEHKIMGHVIPKSKADFGFLLRGLEHLRDDGRLIAILPHGVLFRGAVEGKTREWLVKNKLINAVIGLPDKLFLNTSIPVCVVVVERNSPNVLFVDASKEFEKRSAQNDMTVQQIQKVVDVFYERKELWKYAHVATYEEIQKNEYNLNIPRYVDTFEEEELPDIGEILSEMSKIEREEQDSRKSLYNLLGELYGDASDMRHIRKHRELIEDGIDEL